MALQERTNFGSKIGVILATAGSAVGLGNIWRFPYITGENGGAAFIVCYIVCIVILGLPCMINEFIIGRHARSNTARAYRKLGGRSPWMITGYLGVLTGFLIISYYAVVSGWCLQYIYASLSGHLHGNPQFIKDYFTDFETHPLKPVLCTVLILAATHAVIARGVKGGIEKASKMMMPTLFVLLLLIVATACLLPGAERGIAFLLKPDFGKVSGDVLLGAMGQAFYSLSIGMGCLCTYASYFSKDTNLAGTAVKIGAIDSIVAVLAGLMIFPAAFSVGVEPDSGPSLIFITLPNVFHQAFSSVPLAGDVIAILFYALLSLAALTSLISLHEVSTAFLTEELNIPRRRGALIVTVGAIAVGTFCSLSLGGHEGLQLFGRPLFDIFDFVTGQIFLPIVGFLTCIFVGWRLPDQLVRDEFTNNGALKGNLYRLYIFSIRIVCPAGIALIFLHQLGII